jgi:hypothetical protein
MPVHIDELDVNVSPAPTAATAASAPPQPPLPERWRAAWIAARAAEDEGRHAAHDRDDER